MRRLVAFVMLLTPLCVAAESVVTVTGGVAAKSPFTVSATGSSPQSITHSYVYLDGVLVKHVAGRQISATINASPGSHRVSFTFTQASGEQLRSTMYVNVSGTTQTSRAVGLNWNASSSSGISGYRVYRGTAAGGPYSRITSSTLPALSYEDTNVTAGRSYYYVVTAVTMNGTESLFSREAKAIVP
jgi:multidrug efflux pump subunit AcrA (membrane-fusion protein)